MDQTRFVMDTSNNGIEVCDQAEDATATTVHGLETQESSTLRTPAQLTASDNSGTWNTRRSGKITVEFISRATHEYGSSTQILGENNTVKFKDRHSCTLNIFPVEIREQIFGLVLADYFAHPDKAIAKRRERVVFQDHLDPFTDDIVKKPNLNVESLWETKDTRLLDSERLRIPSESEEDIDYYALSCQDVAFRGAPALETALTPERRLYREMFSMRIRTSIIELRPCLAWDWSYDFPCLSPEWSPSWESLSFSDGEIDRDMLKMIVHQKLPDFTGWVFQYPSLAFLSPLMLDSVRTIEISMEYDYLFSIPETMRLKFDSKDYLQNQCPCWPHRPKFDFTSCGLMHAKFATKLTIGATWPWMPNEYRGLYSFLSNFALRVLEVKMADYDDMIRVNTIREFIASRLRLTAQWMEMENDLADTTGTSSNGTVSHKMDLSRTSSSIGSAFLAVDGYVAKFVNDGWQLQLGLSRSIFA
ncbi:hypothetical protein NHQ30_001963 [Ciborinia camelliae]|nr:hypothetical protein NHQ30_001963 [Ciborinia camelliae]